MFPGPPPPGAFADAHSLGNLEGDHKYEEQPPRIGISSHSRRATIYVDGELAPLHRTRRICDPGHCLA